MANRLSDATSPYLRQHAENPVDWYEWDDEAWAKAKAENKPVFLSVGYSSCHWCHVMAHESFEDDEVAEALNQGFISIKLDREERPDIDDLYMTATQLATGHGGWPMSVFLTPDKKPFFAGTYFPKHNRAGHPGFLSIVQQLAAAWRDQEDEVRQRADEFADGLTQVLERSIPPVSDRITPGFLDQAVQALAQDFDGVHGGFGAHPKFPAFTSIKFLLTYAQYRGSLINPPGQLVESAAHMALFTLERMALGGIRDHVGGGFHRYSTDEKWLLPHFEKMLSDNAQMVDLYARAADLADDSGLVQLFREVADQTVEFLIREMQVGPAFGSALDADTEGQEGSTYVWSREEFARLAGTEVADQYQILSAGNYLEEATGHATGLNIPHLADRQARVNQLDNLLMIRNKRPQPGRDDKQLLAPNALLASALVVAGYTDQAKALLAPWMAQIPHVAHQLDKPDFPAFLDGVAYFADALLNLGLEENANQIADLMVKNFADGRGFTYTGANHEALLGRQKPFLDQSVPSPNGVAISVLRRLGRTSEALEHLSAGLGWAQRAPAATGTLLIECLEFLRMGELEPVAIPTETPTLALELQPTTVAKAEDGFAYAELTVRLPDGFHINGPDPAADWLVPTSVEVSGAYAEASFPPESQERIESGTVISLRLKPRSNEDVRFEVTLKYQICSESECYPPSEQKMVGAFANS